MKQCVIINNIPAFSKAISNICPKNVLICTGASSYEKSGAKKLIESLFYRENLFFFNDFSVNPNIDDLKKGLLLFKNKDIDLVAAAGGGSVIDMAKLLKIFLNSDFDIIQSIKKNNIFIKKNIPLLAIPTTAGSGSEATHFSVIYIDSIKYSVICDSLLPDYVLLLPYLSYSSDAYLASCCGADALCHALESFWSVHSTSRSMDYSKEAITALWEYLPYLKKNDLNVKDKIFFAANAAGMAINTSFTTAPHAYSYGITSLLGVPHGHAVSLTLPYFFNINLNVSKDNCNDPRGEEWVRDRMNDLLKLLDCNQEEIVNKLSAFFQNLFLEKNSIIKSKITREVKQKLASCINLQRLNNNPVKINQNDIENIIFN